MSHKNSLYHVGVQYIEYWDKLIDGDWCLLLGYALSTRCYVCGGLSSLAENCVDDYPAEMRTEDIKDCSEVFGHTVGCTKSKYTDKEGRQIGNEHVEI